MEDVLTVLKWQNYDPPKTKKHYKNQKTDYEIYNSYHWQRINFPKL